MYYDIKYQSPAGYHGMHVAVEASSESEAKILSPIMLSYGTPWSPSEFIVLEVIESQNKPILNKGE